MTVVKKDRPKEYYQYLKRFVTVQKENDQIMKELWDLIGQDKNVQEQAKKDNKE